MIKRTPKLWGRKGIPTLITGKRSLKIYNKCFLFALFLVFFFFAFTSPLKAEELTGEECYELFEHILKVQSHRKMLQLGVDELMKLHENQKLPKNELDTALEVWYTTDSWLRNRVTKLYDNAYSGECFSESRRTKAGDAS
jgi:hypothetical protein